MAENDEKWLFERLEEFEKLRFLQLRYKLGLSVGNVPLADAPQVTAERFITFIKGRNDGDLTKLITAVNEVLGRTAAGGESRTQRRPAGQQEIEGELDLDGKSRPPLVSPMDIPRLHLLCDRDDPVQAVSAAIRSSDGVLVFLIVGYNDQSHDLLIERLRHYELRGHSARSESGQVPYVWINMPERYRTEEHFQEKLEDEIRGADLPRWKCDWSDVAKTFYRKGPVILVASEMNIADWKDRGPEKVRAFLEFWKAWPPPMGQERIVVCLNVRIDRRTRLEKLKYRFVKSGVFQRLNQFVSDNQSLLPAERMFVIEGVKWEHAARWRKLERVRSALERFSLNPDDLEDELDQVHKNAIQWWDKLPTMKRFAKELEALIERTVQARGRGRTPA